MTLTGEHEFVKMDEKQTYLKLCKLSNIVPQECVLSALKLAIEKGEMDLSGKTETSTGWDVIGKTVVTSATIQSLVLRDCLFPSRGLASLVSSLCQGSAVTTMDLRGNNIAELGATQLGKLLRHSTTLQSLSLEWNRLGSHVDSFGLFCAGVSLAPALAVLDLRNNQLTADCAGQLASALRQSNSLHCLDLRWNCVGFKGGQHLLAAVQENTALTRIRLQGNAIPDELVVAVETVAGRNAAHAEARRVRTEKIREEARVQTERLRERAAAESRLREAETESATELAKLQAALAERDAAVATLRSEASAAEMRCRESELRLAERLAGEETMKKESEARLEGVGKRLADREGELRDQLAEREAELTAERRLRLAVESRADQLANQVATLEAEIGMQAEKMRLVRQQHEDALASEQSARQTVLAYAQREADTRVESQRSEGLLAVAREKQRAATVQLEADRLGAELADAVATLAREQARAEESVTSAVRLVHEREEARAAGLELRLTAARDEAGTLQAALAAANGTAAGLQQQNAALLAEITAPQRALVKAHEELCSERQTTQRLRQELLDESGRAASRMKECDDLRERLAAQQQETARLAQTHAERLAALARDGDEQRQRARREEAARAEALYSALNQYLGGAAKAV